MKRALACPLLSAALATLAALSGPSQTPAPALSGDMAPVWREAKWPFAMDQWGTGRVFVCLPSDCGTKVEIYVRPKIGFCNCATGVSDVAEVERDGDLELFSKDSRARRNGRAIKVGWMAGLSRPYLASDVATAENLLSIAFNDECDVIVAVARFGAGDPAAVESGVIGFLNSTPMVLWAKKELGLEYIRRDW